MPVGRQTLPMWESQPPLTPAFPPPTPMTSRNLALFPAGQQMQTLNGPVQIHFSDCMICDKLYEQIADEIVIDYIHHTEYPGEPYYIKEGFHSRYACRYLLPYSHRSVPAGRLCLECLCNPSWSSSDNHHPYDYTSFLSDTSGQSHNIHLRSLC